MSRSEEQDIRFLAEHLLHTGVGGLKERDRRMLARMTRRVQSELGSKIETEEGLTLGERLADRVAELGGSWGFICLFCSFLLGWALLNTDVLRSHAFDPYPYVFLNLILSMLAAIQAPILMMSQNRQAARDRMTMVRDLEVNLKADAAIEQLHKRLEQQHWQILRDMEKLQKQQEQTQHLLAGLQTGDSKPA